MTVLLVALAGCQGSSLAPTPDDPTPAQPYAGLQERDIRALAPERVADLLAGRGAGYALAAELNHYPGPTHVLEMRAELDLSEKQADGVSSIKTSMQREAARLGAELVALEEELDRAFRSAAITPGELSSLTNEIAGVEGKLRSVHLQTHLQMVEVLTNAQVDRYDQLRGYASHGENQPAPADGHDAHGLQH